MSFGLTVLFIATSVLKRERILVFGLLLRSDGHCLIHKHLSKVLINWILYRNICYSYAYMKGFNRVLKKKLEMIVSTTVIPILVQGLSSEMLTITYPYCHDDADVASSLGQKKRLVPNYIQLSIIAACTLCTRFKWTASQPDGHNLIDSENDSKPIGIFKVGIGQKISFLMNLHQVKK
ncbi:hypothetical protein FF38_06813 [Lucilia cuprina]|uniref:Uncharacterized protein n=1 Tax=Lucilia cuprina TaxID=7375 RepID=A0A0L0C717_LUCCU|nr:hypothetical protein FF38_06813 [Lucilia cuprina]